MEQTDSRNSGRTDRSYMDTERTIHNGRYRSATLNRVTTEKRTNERIELAGYAVDLIDVNIKSSVVITDISIEGLRMTRVPKKLAYKETPTKITISGNFLSGCQSLTIMPCWRKRNALYWDVGFYIHNAPEFWKRFFNIVKIRSR